MRAAVPYGRHLKIVRQIVKIARTRIAERPLQISEFSRLLSIEHTAITRAFRAVHDCSPQVYLRNQRLIRARKRILLAREGATVKQIAAQFGFTEFGRSSVRYKTLSLWRKPVSRRNRVARESAKSSGTLVQKTTHLPANPSVAFGQAVGLEGTSAVDDSPNTF
jgi:transcriptional regulator GlxA family with amidase domain